jgi:hypothetical protein
MEVSVMGEVLWPDGRTTSDWYEVAGLMMEMQKEDSISISIEMAVTVHKGRPDLILRATAVQMGEESVGLVPWGSTSVQCSKSRHTTLKGALISLLYQVDFLEAARIEAEEAGL